VLFQRSIHASDDDLSAYLDGRLAAATRERIDGHLPGCAICQRALEGLRAVSSALQGLPAVRAPRSFALREADVRPAARAGGLTRAMPLLSGMTAAALLAFFALVGFDIAGGGSSSSSSASKGANVELLGASDTAKSLAQSNNMELAMTATFERAAAAPNVFGSAVSTPDLATANTFADDAGTLVFRVAPSVVTPEPGTARVASASSNNDMGMHVAEAALASMALASGAGVIIVSRRRST
jgi:anti-sigma factor RsiW